jgi:C-terminal processing protease CtpA/Prc
MCTTFFRRPLAAPTLTILLFGLGGPIACGSDDGTQLEPASSSVSPVHGSAQSPLDGEGVVSLSGAWVAPPRINEMYTERLAMLTDLTGFVRRDSSLALPDDQVTARLVPSGEDRESYRMALPIEPLGTLHRFEGASGAGVQVFAVTMMPNLVGDPFISRYEASGWPRVLTSVSTRAGDQELSGGRVVAWAPETTMFPAGFGPDGKLFTADDPLQALGAGWTVIDLDARPFALLRDENVSVDIRNGDMGRDLSELSYTAAFDQLIDELTARYPYTSVKQLSWSALSAQVRPLVEQAQRDGDAVQLGDALWRLGLLMGDGHAAPFPYPEEAWVARFGAGVGLQLAQTDEGEVLVTAVVPGSPAAAAGIEPGASIERYGELPIAEAIIARPSSELALPLSSPQAVHAHQLELLTRSSVGTAVSVEFRNPGAPDALRAELTSVSDYDGLYTLLNGGVDLSDFPVSASVLPSGVGYIRVTTFSDDLTLMSHAWERGLKMLLGLQVPALIVDVRGNGGGADPMGLYFAGSFYAEPFVRSQQFSLAPGGELMLIADNYVLPAPVQWDRPVAVLIDERCVSVCEEFTAAMAHDPRHFIVGASKTGGAEGEVYQWLLPDEISFISPVGMFRYPNGELFVEGTGIAPNVLVPKTRETLLSGQDYVLEAAVERLTRPGE